MKTKEFIIMTIFTTLSLVVYNFFPTKDIFQQIATILFFLVVLPIVFSKYVLKNSKDLINFRIGNYREGLIYGAASLIFCFIIIFILSYFYGFLNRYTVPIFIVGNFLRFLVYEFLLVLSFIVVYEFYFRGFLMAIFSKNIGYWSILLQFVVFGILVLISATEKEIVQYVPYIIFAPFGGIIALKSKSLIYSAITQFLVIFILNVIIIHKLG